MHPHLDRLLVPAGALLCALALCLAAPSSAHAQDRTAGAALGAWERPAPAERETGVLPRRFRLVGEIGAGLLTLGGGMVIGGLVGLAAAPECGPILCLGDPGISRFANGGVIGAAAATVLVPLALSAGADLHGGRGHVGAAYLGFVVGGAVGAGLIALGVHAIDSCEGWGCLGGVFLGGLSIGFGIAATLVGPFLGYEIADANGGAEAIEVEPSIAVGPDGGTVGATVTF